MHTAHLYELFQLHPRVSTDTRNLEQGDLFFALRGDNFNGNQFAAKALELGACIAIVDDPAVAVSDRYVLVENVLEQLQDLARHHRRQIDVPVIAITGSNGKTTTKELVHAVLKERYDAYATHGNFNNHIGLPLTLLSIPITAEVLVIEMGANHQGEIAALCEIAEPTHGLITNIGRAHLEGFGGLEGVKKGKGELYEWLQKHEGVAFVNTDLDHLEKMAAQQQHPVFYGHARSGPLHFRMEMLQSHPTVKTRYWTEQGEIHDIESQLPGEYNFANIATAITLGVYFKVADDSIKRAIKNYRPENSRSQILEKEGVRFLLDAYNANEDSTEASLRSFSAMAGAKKVVMLGDMLELGEESEEAHQRIGELATSLPIQEVILVGPEYEGVAKKLQTRHFMDSESLRLWFEQQDWSGFFILLKGSRGMRMERVIA